jgi:hypothetical protein
MTVTLEKRIASALTGDTTADDIAGLIEETERAIVHADKVAKNERVKALDLGLSPDPKVARSAMEDAEFASARLRNVLPRLQSHQLKLAAQEYAAKWKQDYEAIKVKRDALAEQLGEYPELVAKIADLFTRIAANDAELSRLHLARPAGVALHLLSAELVARGLGAFSRADPPIAKGLMLPDFAASEKMVWPPPSPPLSSLASFQPPAGVAATGSDWWRYRDQRGKEIAKENERVANYYEGEQREREARQQQG